jgi:hypothetical protein
MTYDSGYKSILGRMGYYSYQSGLIYRHLGQEGGWDPHLARCRNYIISAAARFNPPAITILGSGWLLDIPLAELAENTGMIYLVDIIHPPEVVEQVSSYSNVRLVEADITGGLVQEVWNKARGFSLFRKSVPLASLKITEFKTDFEPGLVISLNILTQLENLPVEMMKRKTKAVDNEIADLRRKIQQSHLDFLLRHKSVLITDFEEVYNSGKGENRTVTTMFVKVEGGIEREEWTWDFDLKESDYYGSRSVMKVMAVTFT